MIQERIQERQVDSNVVLKNTFVHVDAINKPVTRTRCFSDALHLREADPAPFIAAPVLQFTPIPECPQDGPTTAMIRNVPNKYTPKELVDDFLAAGFTGALRFFYMPFDLDTEHNLGFAFADFRTAADLDRFKTTFDGVKLPHHKTHKICQITPARIQGFHANLDHLSKGQAIKNLPDEFKATIFAADGTASAFPPCETCPSVNESTAAPTTPITRTRRYPGRLNPPHVEGPSAGHHRSGTLRQ